MSYLEPDYYLSHSPFAPLADSYVDYGAAASHSPMSSCSSATAYSPQPLHLPYSYDAYAKAPYSYGTYAGMQLAPGQGPDDCHKHAAQLHYAATLELDAALEAQDIGRCLGCLDT